jgi:hypothetical protein
MKILWVCMLLRWIWAPKGVIHDLTILNAGTTIFLVNVTFKCPVADFLKVSTSVNAVYLGLHKFTLRKPGVIQGAYVRATS